MKHTIITYTVDVAHVPEFDPTELVMAMDGVLESHPFEFEDWKVTVTKEEREV